MLDDDDIEEFVNGLKQAGLLGGDAAALAPSSPGGVLANSSSAPVVLASAGVGGKYEMILIYCTSQYLLSSMVMI